MHEHELDTTRRHSLWDDVVGILTGTYVAALGVTLLKAGHVVTGGVAGLSLLLSYGTQLPFAILLPVCNAPFLVLALTKKGGRFTVKSIVSVILVSVMQAVNERMLHGLTIPTAYASITGNLLVGVALIIVFRHGASLGGFNVIALLAQERLGLRAGYVQLALDVIVVLASFAAVAPMNVLLSAVGATVLNISLATNHRPGRYTAY